MFDRFWSGYKMCVSNRFGLYPNHFPKVTALIVQVWKTSVLYDDIDESSLTTANQIAQIG